MVVPLTRGGCWPGGSAGGGGPGGGGIGLDPTTRGSGGGGPLTCPYGDGGAFVGGGFVGAAFIGGAGALGSTVERDEILLK